MSRPSPFQRYRTQRDDSESVPLAGATEVPEAWYEERDLTDERLPTYGEAVHHNRRTTSSQPPAAATSTGEHPPREQMVLSSSRQSGRTLNVTQKSLLNFSPCLLAPIIALILGTLFRFDSCVQTRTDYSAMDYLSDYAGPSPPTALPSNADRSKMIFIVWVVVWGVIGYPF